MKIIHNSNPPKTIYQQAPLKAVKLLSHSPKSTVLSFADSNAETQGTIIIHLTEKNCPIASRLPGTNKRAGLIASDIIFSVPKLRAAHANFSGSHKNNPDVRKTTRSSRKSPA